MTPVNISKTYGKDAEIAGMMYAQFERLYDQFLKLEKSINSGEVDYFQNG